MGYEFRAWQAERPYNTGQHLELLLSTWETTDSPDEIGKPDSSGGRVDGEPRDESPPDGGDA
jgi:hypothetical protein